MTPNTLHQIAQAADALCCASIWFAFGLSAGASLHGPVGSPVLWTLAGLAVICLSIMAVAEHRAATAPDSSDAWFDVLAEILDVNAAAFAFQRVAISADDRRVTFSGPTVAAWALLADDHDAIRRRTEILAQGWHVHEIGINSLILQRDGDDDDPRSAGATAPATA